MTSVATSPERVHESGRGRTLAASLLAAAPLVGSYLALVLVYSWHGLSHGSPWLFSDELQYAELSRSIAETGSAALRGEPAPFISLYTYVLAPVWWLDDTLTAYDAAKYLGSFLMASAIFPAYWLARLLVPGPAALYAAVASAAVPMLAYSRLLVTEVLAYPFAALGFFLVVKALATRRVAWLAAAAAAVALAPLVRGQLGLLAAVYAGSALVVLWLGERGRRFRAGWGPVQWAAAVAGLAVCIHIAHRIGRETVGQYHAASLEPGRVLDFSIWAWGSFVIGLGILPALAAAVALWRPADAGRREYQAFVGVLGLSIVGFGAYTAVKAVYLSTTFANVVAERNLVYLAPLIFAATALFLHRPAANPLLLAGAGAVVAYLMEETPFQLDHYPYFDAPSLSVLAVFNRELAMPDASIETMLLWATIACSALVLAAGAIGPARRRLRPAVAAVALAAVAWSLTGLISFGNGVNDLGNRFLTIVPDPPNWVDNVTGGASTMYVGQGIADGNPVYLTEFWNRSVEAVGTLDGQDIGPGPTRKLVPYARDGRVVNDPGVDYVVTNTPGVDPLGTVAYATGDWRLYRVQRPLRLRTAITGLYPDGWSGPRATYSHFTDPGRRGVVDVLVSRAAWGGEDKPGTVTIRVGSLVPSAYDRIMNPCRGDVCVDANPMIGRLEAEQTWTVHAGQERVFHFPVTTPFRVEVTVDPTFSPAEFGGTDLRQFGARLAFVFKPG